MRTDFLGEPFDGSHYLLARADQIIEIKTICHCGRKATMVVRGDGKGRALTTGPRVQIGSNYRYVFASRVEFKKVLAGEGSIPLLREQSPVDEPKP